MRNKNNEFFLEMWENSFGSVCINHYGINCISKLFEERIDGSINFGTEQNDILNRSHTCSFGDLRNRKVYIIYLHSEDISLMEKKLII
jgi:hypothetical protein